MLRLHPGRPPSAGRTCRGRRLGALAIGAFGLLASTARATDSRPAEGAVAAAPSLQLQRYTLDNGLRVVLNEDHTAPSVAVCVTYDVGSKDEPQGRSGFAHLFEHLMFQGSRNVPKGDHFRLLAARGGKANGTTNKDRTTYYETVPSGELALALWLEADRMNTLALTRRKFENQRKVVQEEYRKNYSGRTYALGRVRLHQLAYQTYWPYQHPTIGFMEDLDAARYEWLTQFYRDHYAPDRAVLSVAGDFEDSSARELIERYFGPIQPSKPAPEFVPLTDLPRQTSERLSVIEDRSANTPGVYYGWLIPPSLTREHRALELAAELLAGGESSRLHQSLVLEKASSTRVHAWTSGARGVDLLTIQLQVAKLSSVDTNQKWLDGELKRMRLLGPSDDELSGAKARLLTRRLRDLQRNNRRAIELGKLEALWGDASLLAEEFAAYSDLSRAEVRAAAAKYLQDTRRSIVEVYPPGWVRDIGPAIITKTHVVKKGQNLSTIARIYGTTVKKIAKANGISSKKPIFPGQRLLVTVGAGGGPRLVTKTHTVKKGDNLIRIAKKYGTTVRAIAKENKISAKKAIIIGQKLNITLEVGGTKSSRGSKKATKPSSSRAKRPTRAPKSSKQAPHSKPRPPRKGTSK